MRLAKVMAVAGGAALAAVGVAGAAAAALSFGVERATVTITPPTRYVEATSTLHGAVQGGDFQTQRLRVTLTETLQGAASGVTTTPGRYATGSVVFNHECVLIGTPPHQYCAPITPVPAGTALYTSSGLTTYVILRTVSCFCGESIPVRSSKAGAVGNTAAHTIDLYSNRLIGVGGFTPWESADNPAPVSGGIDGSTHPVVRQPDIDAASASLRTRLASDLESAITKEAGDLHSIANTPSIATSSDRSAGAAVASFEVTASGSSTATAFADADARARISAALAAEVPAGWRLVGRPVVVDYQVQGSTPEGGVTVSGEAGGYEAPSVSTSGLATRLRGQGVKAALAEAQAAAPSSTVELQVWPASVPWLPMNPGRIAVVVRS